MIPVMAHLSRNDRAEMFRGHLGIVTALVADDEAAAQQQIASLIGDQLEAAGEDIGSFAKRMAKQLEGGARVTTHLVMSLARRLEMTEAELVEALAAIYNSDSIKDAMPE